MVRVSCFFMLVNFKSDPDPHSKFTLAQPPTRLSMDSFAGTSTYMNNIEQHVYFTLKMTIRTISHKEISLSQWLLCLTVLLQEIYQSLLSIAPPQEVWFWSENRVSKGIAIVFNKMDHNCNLNGETEGTWWFLMNSWRFPPFFFSEANPTFFDIQLFKAYNVGPPNDS
jgi:hypothetical protein